MAEADHGVAPETGIDGEGPMTQGVDALTRRVDDLEAQIERQNWELESRDAALEALSRQLRSSQDKLQQLGPLDYSPKLQLLALRRSLPRAIRQRLGTYRGKRAARRAQPDAKEPPARTPPNPAAFLYASPVSLSEVLHICAAQRLADDPESLQRDVLAGRAVTHDQSVALSVSRHHPPAASDAPPNLRPTLRMKDEAITGSYEELVTQVDPELVTIDIWDTLIMRNRPADAAKTATARRILLAPHRAPGSRGMDPFDIMRLRNDIEAEMSRAHPGGEYELTAVLVRLLEQLGHKPGPTCRSYARSLADAEVADEISWSWAHQEVLHIAQSHGERAVLASDFYMTGEDLAKIVQSVAGQDLKTVVSIDRGLSKRLDGALLKALREEHGVNAADHLHLGDNEHSDVNNQIATGGVAIQVPRWSPFPGPGSFASNDLAACWAELDRQLAIYDSEHPTEDLGRLAGREAAVFAVALVARGLEEAWQRYGDRVHYVSREGIFLCEIHDAIEPILRPLDGEAIKHIHLALSRRATFGASLEEPLHVSLQRMWSMYAKQSVSAMLISIGLDPDSLRPLLQRHGLDPDTRLKDPSRDPRVLAFLNDPDARATINEHIRHARGLLHEYVLSRTNLEAPFIVVDIGWRGTIQDNLVRALGIRQSLGVYLGLFPFLNAQPFGTTKIGVAFDGNEGEEFRYAHPPAALERPWTPDVPSTVAFAKDASGAIVATHDKEVGHVSPAIRAFQEGSLEVAPIIARWMVGMGLTTSVLHHDLGDRARRFWGDPPPGVADIWFDSEHDDSFGALNETSFGKLSPNADWLEGELRQHLRAGETASEWPAGYRAWRPVRGIIELARTAVGRTP